MHSAHPTRRYERRSGIMRVRRTSRGDSLPLDTRRLLRRARRMQRAPAAPLHDTSGVTMQCVEEGEWAMKYSVTLFELWDGDS
ncbi:hypothetical protein MTO96_013625 [Rhipicephalus appendiculatus]